MRYFTPSDDSVHYGAITYRKTGLSQTLANYKPGRLGTDIKMKLYDYQGTDRSLIGFDFSGQESVIAAVYNSYEYCNFNSLKPDPLATEGARMVLLGKSSEGTDIYSMLGKTFKVERAIAKTLTLGTIFGSGVAGNCKLLRPKMKNKTESQLKELVKKFLDEFKGTREWGAAMYQGGLMSYFFNYAQRLMNEETPRLPFSGNAISNTMRPKFIGQDYHTTRMNWCVQASGSALLDFVLYTMYNKLVEANLLEQVYLQLTVHDEVVYSAPDLLIPQVSLMLKDTYVSSWKAFFEVFQMVPPQELLDNLSIEVGKVYKKS